MCRRLGACSMIAGFLGLLVVGLRVVPAHQVAAHESPAGCAGNGLGSSFTRSRSGNVTHANSITSQTTVSNSATGCHVTGLNASITLRNDTLISVASNATPLQGTSLTCPNPAEPRCVTAGPYSYTVA